MTHAFFENATMVTEINIYHVQRLWMGTVTRQMQVTDLTGGGAQDIILPYAEGEDGGIFIYNTLKKIQMFGQIIAILFPNELKLYYGKNACYYGQ